MIKEVHIDADSGVVIDVEDKGKGRDTRRKGSTDALQLMDSME